MIDCIKAVCSFEKRHLTGVNYISDHDGGLVVVLIQWAFHFINSHFKVLISVVKESPQETFSGEK